MICCACTHVGAAVEWTRVSQCLKEVCGSKEWLRNGRRAELLSKSIAFAGRRSAHLDKCSHWSRSSFLQQEFGIRILKRRLYDFGRRGAHRASLAYPPSDDLQSWSSERQATSEPGNQNQSLAAAILALSLLAYLLLLLYCSRACFYCTTQYALKASFSSTND